MCPVQWVRPRARIMGPQFLRCPPLRQILILSRPDQHSAVMLHWQEERGQSFPCMGEPECRLCPGHRKVHVYAPVLVKDVSRSTWTQAILDLGHADSDLANLDFTKKAIVIDRKEHGNKRTDLCVKGYCSREVQATAPVEAELFDIRPHLCRRWGLFDEADYFSHSAYTEQPRLDFDGKESRKGGS